MVVIPVIASLLPAVGSWELHESAGEGTADLDIIDLKHLVQRGNSIFHAYFNFKEYPSCFCTY